MKTRFPFVLGIALFVSSAAFAQTDCAKGIPYEPPCQFGCADYADALAVIPAPLGRNQAIAMFQQLPENEQITAVIAQVPSNLMPWVLVFRPMRNSSIPPQLGGVHVGIETMDYVDDAVFRIRDGGILVLTNWKTAVLSISNCPIEAGAGRKRTVH